MLGGMEYSVHNSIEEALAEHSQAWEKRLAEQVRVHDGGGDGGGVVVSDQGSVMDRRARLGQKEKSC